MSAQLGRDTNFSAMRKISTDPTKKIDLWDWVKYVPLGIPKFVSFGGEIRERFESYENEFFSPNPSADNAYLL